MDGRIGNNMGDHRSTGDNESPLKVLDYDWEVPVTMNDTWGFKKNDHSWKSPQTLMRQLFDVVSKNGNYLLDVGPTADGVIPQPSLERLQEVGAWLRVNGDAVYGAKPSPFHTDFLGIADVRTGESVPWDYGLARERELWVKRIFEQSIRSAPADG